MVGNSNDGRFLENILYGTPVLPGSTTSDGRTVSELHRGRMEAVRQHAETTALQRETVRTLRNLHGGGESLVRREDYLAHESETHRILQSTAAQMAGIQLRQHELLDEARVLNKVAMQGFGYMGQAVGQVREEVQGVTRALEEGTRTLHGPSFPAEKLEIFLGRRRSFFEVLGARQKGILSEGASRELDEWTDQQFGAEQAVAAVERFLDENLEDNESACREIRARARVLSHPSDLLGAQSREARENLSVMERLAVHCQDERLRTAIQNARGLVRLSDQARRSGISEGLVVDLTNHGFTSDAMQHEIKRSHRGARRGGTGVDRAYHLMELLDQGDQAGWQRERGLQQGQQLVRLAHARWLAQNKLVEQGEMATGQRGELIALAEAQQEGVGELVELTEEGLAQGRRLAGLATAHLITDIGIGVETHRRLGRLEEVGEEGNRYLEVVATHAAALIEEGRVGNHHLRRISEALIGNNQHLVNLEVLGARFIETMGEGFRGVANVIRDGFSMEAEALAELTFEVALARAKVVGRLETIEDAVREMGTEIQREITKTNALLGQLIDLTAHPLRTRARERVQQGFRVLSRAKNIKTVAGARRLFEQVLEEDPTVVEAYFGAATTAELEEDHESASEHFEVVGEEASIERADLAAAGWRGYAKARENLGDLPGGIAGLRKVLEREGERPSEETRFMLARALVLCGFNEEAMEVLIGLVHENTDYLYAPSRNKAFDAFPVEAFYRALLEHGRLRRSDFRIFIAREFLVFGSAEKAMEIIRNLRPVDLLRSGLLESVFANEMRENAARWISEMLLREPPFAAETWYAYAFVALKLGFKEATILLQKGLEQDTDFYTRDASGLRERLRMIDPTQTESLIETAVSAENSLSWLKI